MIKTDLQKLIQEECNKLGITRQVVLEHPQELTHGDFATSIALSAAKDLKQNPKELAETIATKIRESADDRIADVSVAGPGFINIVLTKQALYQELARIAEGYGSNNLYEGKNILVEHSSPNLFKPFHIGHLMNNAVGEATVRILKNTGADVTTISYPSDISLGIAKAVYVMTLDASFETYKTIGEQLQYLSECYVRGTKLFEENDEVQASVRAVLQKIYAQEPSQEYTYYCTGKEVSETYFKDMTARLGSSFDGFVYESQTGPIGKKIVQENIPNVFIESDGAVIYDGEKKGLHTRVFINKEGNPTYEAKDIGLLQYKFAMYKPDISVFVTDHEQAPYFSVVSSAAGEIHKDWQDKTVHLTHGRMTFKGAKMSSRLGGVPTALEVLTTIQDVAKEKFTEKTEEKDKNSSAEMIAIAALKFSILKVALGKPVNFDPEVALSFEGDSGPYIQYSYVRTQTLLEKGSAVGIAPNMSHLFTQSPVERLLYRFEEITLRAAEEYAPHHIVQYLLELAQAFNSWYGQEKIINEEEKEYSAHKLAVVEAVGIILKRGLYLLGIQTPERM